MSSFEVQAVGPNTQIPHNMSYTQCVNFQSNRIRTSGSGHLAHCVRARCVANRWQTNFLLSENLVTCTNGNNNHYQQIIRNTCGQFT